MSTKEQRRKLANDLGKRSREWLKMSDAELLAELRKEWPMVASATREECIRTLVMFHVEKMI